MDIQDKYDTALSLLQSLGEFTQKEIASLLKSEKVNRSSETNLSRAKSEPYKGTNFRKRPGELSDEQLAPLVEGLEVLLKKKLNIVFDPRQGKYIDAVSGNKYDAIYKTALVPELGEEKLGLVRLYESLPTEYLNQSIAGAKEVRIIQTYLTGVENLKLSLEAALKKGANIKILLMEPELDSAGLRSKGLINKQVNVRAKILDNRSELEELHDKYPGQFQLKYYNEIPGLNLFAVDDKLLIGFYWYKQYAIYGTYLELKNDDYYPLAKNVNTHWNKLWDSYSGETQQDSLTKACYRCFFIREGNPQSFVLEINNFTKEAIVCETPSGDEYRGDVINLLGFCGIRAETVKAGNTYRSRSKRIANFLINTGNEESLGNQEIVIAVYSNISPQGLAYGNIMVLAKVANRADTVGEEKKSLINEYLKNSEIKIANSNIRDFEGLNNVLVARIEESKSQLRMNFLNKMAGEYIYYTFEKDEVTGKKKIQPRSAKITSGGTVHFQGNTVESRGRVRFLNPQNILIEKETEIGLASYFYVLQPCNSLISELFGYYSGISMINQPKGAGAYFVKEDGAYGRTGLEPVFVDSEVFASLLKGYPKMRAVFSNG